MSERARIAVFVAVVLAGLGLVVAQGIGKRQADQRHSIGVLANGNVVELRPGQEACEGPTASDGPLPMMAFVAATNVPGPDVHAGPPLVLRARRGFGGPPIASARVDGGYTGNNAQVIGKLDRPIPADTSFVACAENVGTRRVALLGEMPQIGYAVNSTAEARTGDTVLPGDIGVYFPAVPQRRPIELVPDMVHRAAVFRPDAIGPWTFWLAIALMVAGVPWLLVRALRLSGDTDHALTSAPSSPRREPERAITSE